MRGIKTRTDRKWKNMIFFLLLLLIFGFIVNSVRKVYNKKKEAEKVLAAMKDEADELAKREKFLTRSLERLETDEGIKFEIRKKLNVAEVGESVAIIVDENEPVTSKNKPQTLWQKIKDFFGSI